MGPNNKSVKQVFIAMFLALILGLLSRDNLYLIELYDFFGLLFLQGLKLVVVPLVVTSVICGSAKLAQSESIKLLGKKTLLYFFLTSFCAVCSGLIVVYFFSPYFSFHQTNADPLSTGAAGTVIQHTPTTFWDVIRQLLLQIVPANIVAAAAQNQLLGLIFISILFGWYSTKVEPEQSKLLITFCQGSYQLIMRITKLFMRAMPFGICALIAKVVATTGFAALKPLALFSLSVVTALLFYSTIILPTIVKIFSKISIKELFKALFPALITGFSTSSTAATMPVTMECLEKKAHVPSRITSFVLPLGASVNLAGSALYQAVAVVFISAAYGMSLTFASYFLIAVMALITSLGMAGVPSACLVSIVIILQTLGLPGEGIAFIIAVERLLDMVRTPVSIWTNSCCAALVHAAEASEAQDEKVVVLTKI